MFEPLIPLGWSDRLTALAADLDPTWTIGRISRVDRGMATVLVGVDETMRAHFGTDPLTIGDWVAVDDEPRVAAVLERSSLLRRLAAGERDEAQLLAANVDRIFILQPLPGGPNLRRLERELVVAWDSGAVPVLLLTKTDQLDAATTATYIEAAEEVAVGVVVVAVSAVDGTGLDTVRALLHPNLTAVAMGASGAGKSTLINALVGVDLQATGEVREDDQRGRHTTTASALIRVPGGGIYLDTPGIRSVGLWTDSEALAAAFSDIEELTDGCRFSDCAHESEPGCAVMDAVRAGTLAADRVTSWHKLRREVAHLTDEREGWRKAADARKPRGSGRSGPKKPYRP